MLHRKRVVAVVLSLALLVQPVLPVTRYALAQEDEAIEVHDSDMAAQSGDEMQAENPESPDELDRVEDGDDTSLEADGADAEPVPEVVDVDERTGSEDAVPPLVEDAEFEQDDNSLVAEPEAPSEAEGEPADADEVLDDATEPAEEGAVALEAQATKSEVEKYTYAVAPLLSPFNEFLFVKTDNPDPWSFRLVDKATTYVDGESVASFELCDRAFVDVVYEDVDTYRVDGGYLFVSKDWDSDGGTLVVQAVDGAGRYSRTFTDTSVTVSCPSLQSMYTYLIECYTTSDMGFFEKLDAIQSSLEQISEYPKSVIDTENTLPDRPYPFLAASPYPELSLNDHYENYCQTDGVLIQSLYPFTMDSLGFPSTMYYVAQLLDPNCTMKRESLHYAVSITHDGETQVYGGAGNGGADPMCAGFVDMMFSSFDVTSDNAANTTLDELASQYEKYASQSGEVLLRDYELIRGEGLAQAVGKGAWLRIAVEPFVLSNGVYTIPTGFTYAYGGEDGWASIASDAWVNGRYVTVNELYCPGERFVDHEDASVLMLDYAYTDRNGQPAVMDAWFYYEAETDD